MKLGLIGNPLGHSWSPQIHSFFLKDCTYDLWPLKEDELDDFFARKDFDGINVTIPYKEKVMQYLDEIDDTARTIGAVNCIVNDHGRLIGHNTDWIGFMDMVKSAGIEANGKKCAVFGSGGASKAACAAIRKMNGTPVAVSRHPKENQISYADLKDEYAVLINATPLGMKPNDNAMPVDPALFPGCEAVVDIVANPLRTKFCFEAGLSGKKTLGGFEMLVRQAAAADLLFTGKAVSEEQIRACMKMLYGRMRSLVLIGMPTSGKSTIAAEVSRRSGRKLIEMDEEIEKKLGMSIRECFDRYGEAYFRKAESEMAASLKEAGGCVISCGGGIIKNKENMRMLSENGLVAWLDRDPALLFGTGSRPLSQNKDDIARLYEERKSLYEMYADVRIDNNGNLEDTVNEVMKLL